MNYKEICGYLHRNYFASETVNVGYYYQDTGMIIGAIYGGKEGKGK